MSIQETTNVNQASDSQENPTALKEKISHGFSSAFKNLQLLYALSEDGQVPLFHYSVRVDSGLWASLPRW